MLSCDVNSSFYGVMEGERETPFMHARNVGVKAAISFSLVMNFLLPFPFSHTPLLMHFILLQSFLLLHTKHRKERQVFLAANLKLINFAKLNISFFYKGKR